MPRLNPWVPAALAFLALAALAVWLARGPGFALKLRLPGADHAAGDESGAGTNPVVMGKRLSGGGQPADVPGLWPQLRGPNRDGINTETVRLARNWDSSGPRELWSVDVGEGYAGAAVLGGRVYVMDYDRESRQDALRCLSLADGREIWRYAYPMTVKRNHGMSRTVPAVTEKYVVAMGPKCHVVCVDAVTGQLRWGLDLVRQFGATVPPWYAGQCVLVDNGAVILAPGGKNALLLAVDVETGKVLWQTPNPRGWKMTHSSVMPTEFAGQRMFVYCANSGVVGASAKDGALLWETTDWKISIATVPSPLVLDGGRIFLTGGYNAGSLMLQLESNQPNSPPADTLSLSDGERAGVRGGSVSNAPSASFSCRQVFKLAPEVFGATQHTPILYRDHLYGARADGQFVCLSLDGKAVWASPPGSRFGLGSFVLADELIFAMDDSGLLRLIEATPAQYNQLAQAKVLHGHESWGPLALTAGRLIARDLTRLVCLDVTARP